MRISYTCFEVSAICNMDCEFCFSRWRENKNQLPYEKVIYILDKLKSNGLEAINLTGGDPLLRSDIKDICKHAKEIGLMVIISTNGIKLKDNKEVLNYIDAINLPLDSSLPSIHNEMRPCALTNHHQYVLDLIDYIEVNYPNIIIKVNTMVGRPNIDSVLGIGDLLINKNIRWKLGKFFSSGYGKNYEEKYTITNEEYERVVNACRQKYLGKIIKEDFIIEEDNDIFIDTFGHINIVTKEGVIDYGEIDNLDNVTTSKDELWKDYLYEVYKGG